jgi:aspartate/methionine/tyrosine aminotransferase
VQIAPFLIERWYERFEFIVTHMLSSSDCESRTVAELLALEPDARERLDALRLGYTEVRGSLELRTAIAATYEKVTPDDVLVLAAAEEGIFTFWHALVRPGDHVVVETPCYGSALEVARSTGATVEEWARHPDDEWAHDLDALIALVRPETRALYINTPHNPTGLGMPAHVLAAVTELCDERGIVLFSDEVYRGLEHDAARRLPAACDVSAKAVSLGTVSKAYGLPGLRLGWLVTRDRALLDAIVGMKLYTTICSSAPSELLVEVAVRHRATLIEDARRRCLTNLPRLRAFVAARPELSWTEPDAGPIGFARMHGVDDTTTLCVRIATEADVLILPGEVYGVPGFVRFGYGRAGLVEAVEHLEAWLDAHR